MERRTAAVAWMLSAGLLLISQAARADGFVYRDRCPVPMNVVETEAYFCEATGYKDLGKRVDAAYQAQVAHLHSVYSAPGDAADLSHELEVLEASQTGWKAYIANQCAAEGYMAWHGSLEPQLVGQCVTRLAELRIKELQGLAEGLGN